MTAVFTPSFSVLDDVPFRAALDLVRLTDWHATIPDDVFRTACDNSVCFGIAAADAPRDGWAHEVVAFARVVTDRATYAYLCDVVVHPGWRGRGYSRRLVEATLAHAEIGSLRRYSLLTRHAAGLYRKYDFVGGDPGVTYLERTRAQHGLRADLPAGAEQR